MRVARCPDKSTNPTMVVVALALPFRGDVKNAMSRE